LKYNIYPWQNEHVRRLEEMVPRLPHAILIHGPQGVGKLALAEHFAKRLLCETEGNEVPCGHCEGCRWVAAWSHPDLRRVEPEAIARGPEVAGDDEEAPAPAAKAGKPSTEIRIEQIRGLDGFLNLRSHRGRRRIALVHPAEAMNANAANALLKSLEEPPAGAFFLLVSHRPARLPATIRSRCVAMPIGVPEGDTALAWLASQGVQEAGKWLDYASGAPLAALELSQGSAARVARLRSAIDAGDLETLQGVNDREALEALAEALQKYALDRAFGAFAGKGKYGGVRVRGSGLAWLRYARRMGRDRALARHPLNPRLFAGEMLAGMPRD